MSDISNYVPEEDILNELEPVNDQYDESDDDPEDDDNQSILDESDDNIRDDKPDDKLNNIPASKPDNKPINNSILDSRKLSENDKGEIRIYAYLRHHVEKTYVDNNFDISDQEITERETIFIVSKINEQRRNQNIDSLHNNEYNNVKKYYKEVLTTVQMVIQMRRNELELAIKNEREIQKAIDAQNNAPLPSHINNFSSESSGQDASDRNAPDIIKNTPPPAKKKEIYPIPEEDPRYYKYYTDD